MEMTLKRISQLEPDEILNLLGTFSRYQQIIYFLLGLVIFRGVFPVLGIILIGGDPGHVCNTSFYNDSITTDSGNEGTSQCYMHTRQEGKNVTIPCPGPWKYITSFTSIVTEWDLVCDRTYLVDLSSTIYMIGCAFGCVFLMPLGDRFGRRRILFVSLVCMSFLNIGLAFSNSITLFIVLRFIIGALNMTITLIVYCMIAEFLPSTHRTLPVIGASFFWSFGIMILALVGYLIKDWRILQILISLPNLVVLLLWWFLPESLTWLFLKGNHKEMLIILQSSAKWNKKSLPPDLLPDCLLKSSADPNNKKEADSHCPEISNFLPDSDPTNPNHPMPSDTLKKSASNDASTLEETDKKMDYINPTQNGLKTSNSEEVQTFQSTSCLTDTEKNQNNAQGPDALSIDIVATVSIRSLFSTPRMLLYTLITFYLLMVVSLSYFGILLNTPALPGNIYVNLFFSAAVEIGANIVVMFIINRTGRRKPICCFLLICGLSNLVTLGIFYSEIQNKFILMLVWTMIGRFGISGSYSMIYLLLAEIFPTAVRNQAMGSASLFENLGSIMAPLVMLLAKNDIMLPLSIFGILTLIGGSLVLLLPETHLKPLPVSIKQVESW